MWITQQPSKAEAIALIFRVHKNADTNHELSFAPEDVKDGYVVSFGPYYVGELYPLGVGAEDGEWVVRLDQDSSFICRTLPELAQ